VLLDYQLSGQRAKVQTLKKRERSDRKSEPEIRSAGATALEAKAETT